MLLAYFLADAIHCQIGHANDVIFVGDHLGLREELVHQVFVALGVVHGDRLDVLPARHLGKVVAQHIVGAFGQKFDGAVLLKTSDDAPGAAGNIHFVDAQIGRPLELHRVYYGLVRSVIERCGRSLRKLSDKSSAKLAFNSRCALGPLFVISRSAVPNPGAIQPDRPFGEVSCDDILVLSLIAGAVVACGLWLATRDNRPPD